MCTIFCSPLHQRNPAPKNSTFVLSVLDTSCGVRNGLVARGTVHRLVHIDCCRLCISSVAMYLVCWPIVVRTNAILISAVGFPHRIPAATRRLYFGSTKRCTQLFFERDTTAAVIPLHNTGGGSVGSSRGKATAATHASKRYNTSAKGIVPRTAGWDVRTQHIRCLAFGTLVTSVQACCGLVVGRSPFLPTSMWRGPICGNSHKERYLQPTAIKSAGKIGNACASSGTTKALHQIQYLSEQLKIQLQ